MKRRELVSITSERYLQAAVGHEVQQKLNEGSGAIESQCWINHYAITQYELMLPPASEDDLDRRMTKAERTITQMMNHGTSLKHERGVQCAP